MKILHLRVHKDREECLRIAEWVKTQTIRMLAVYEKDAERDHMHIMFITDLSIERMRAKILERFKELKGKRNEYYGLSVKDDMEAQERYLCKGEQEWSMPDIILCTHHYTDDKIRERHEQYWEINRQLREDSKNAKTESFLHYVCKQLPDKMDFTNNYDKRIVFLKVMECLGKKAKVMDSIIVRRLCNGVWNIKDHKRFGEYMYQLVYEPLDRCEAW